MVYFPYPSVVKAFQAAGIDAAFDEKTLDKNLARKVAAWTRLSLEQRVAVGRALVRLGKAQLDSFIAGLERAVGRQVETVHVLPLHGSTRELSSVAEAIAFVQSYTEAASDGGFVAYEIQVRFNNGDRIEGRFTGKDGAVAFLQVYLRARTNASDPEGRLVTFV